MAPHRKNNGPPVEQLHHRAAFSIAIIISNMVFNEHQQYCMKILEIHNPTQIYVKILELLDLAEYNHRQKSN